MEDTLFGDRGACVLFWLILSTQPFTLGQVENEHVILHLTPHASEDIQIVAHAVHSRTFYAGGVEALL